MFTGIVEEIGFIRQARPDTLVVEAETVLADLKTGDSVAIDFVVFPNGIADTSSVEVLGASDPQFVRNAVRFAARHRFAPAQVRKSSSENNADAKRSDNGPEPGRQG